MEMLGENLFTKEGPKPTGTVLSGKQHVLLYFSAHGNPQCQEFFPLLSDIYHQYAVGKSFEVVQVSCDKNPADFVEGLNRMPWNAIPFEKSDVVQRLCHRFKVDALPMLVVLDRRGDVVTMRGHLWAREDPRLNQFPWPKPSWERALGGSFLAQDGRKVGKEALGKTVGLYFSAHWCPPCQQFTPELAKFYAEYKRANPAFEIVFVSSDRDEKSMKEYFASQGGYLALPWGDERKAMLSEYCGVRGIPHFSVVDTATGRILCNDGKGAVRRGAQHVAQNGWSDPLVIDIANGPPESQGASINDVRSIVVRCEGCSPDDVNMATQALEAVAREYSNPRGTPSMLFFINTRSGGPGEQLTSLTSHEGSARCRVPGRQPLMLMFDIPDKGAFYESPATTITPAAIREFISDISARRVRRLQLCK